MHTFLALAMLGILYCGAGTAFAADIPDASKTPGLARAGLSKAKICATKWGKDERHVTQAMKDQVFSLYGYSGYQDSRCVPDANGKTCEIDHLLGREIGGADDVSNLVATFTIFDLLGADGTSALLLELQIILMCKIEIIEALFRMIFVDPCHREQVERLFTEANAGT